MASVARQPFAPLDSARLQSLISTKNRQNAIPAPSPGKRKAGLLDLDDCENADPLYFSKRSKGLKLDALSKDALKAINSLENIPTPTEAARTQNLVAASSTPAARSALLSATPKKPLAAAASRRSIPQPKTPIARTSSSSINVIGNGHGNGASTRISTSAARPSAYSSPAGRSPTSISKRSASLSSTRRRTFGSYTRIDPPSFGSRSSTAAPFSLDAALKGTIPAYVSRTPATPAKKAGLSKVARLLQPETKSGWYFDIHEDSPEQEMTNLLQHSTCVLDISSDEETEERASRDTAEGRNKENIPPADHLSQTSTRRETKGAELDDMMVEKQRIALGEINAAEFYPEGCDASSVILVFEEADRAAVDDEDDAVILVGEQQARIANITTKTAIQAVPKIEIDGSELPLSEDIDEVMAKRDAAPPKLAVLEPIEGTGESFELWESDSSKDENEAPAASP